MQDWLTKITAFFVDLAKSIFGALVSWIHDAALWLFDGVLQAIAGLLAAIPVPSFISGGANIGSLFSSLPAYPLYVLSHCQFGTAMAILGAGVAFRLTRKLLTIGQW